MRPMQLWRGAALVVLGTTTGFLALEHAYRHPESVAAAVGWLNPSSLLAVGRVVCCQAAQNGTETAPSNNAKPSEGSVASAVEESGDPIQGEAGSRQTRKTNIIQLRNVQAADVVSMLQNVFADAASFVAVAEPVSNKLIINIEDGPVGDSIRRLIEQIDVQPAQVQIDVLIADVDCKDGKELWGVFGDGKKLATMSHDQFKALVNDLQKEDRLHVVAAPQIITTDNQSARILIGQSFPYITGTVAAPKTTSTPPATTDPTTTEPSGDRGVPTSVSPEGVVSLRFMPEISTDKTATHMVAYRDVGIQVQVMTKISPDGTVVMRIIPELSTATTTTIQVFAGVFATAFDVQTLETTVAVKDGETEVVGGLTRMRETGTTWFGFPQKEKTEVLVFVTPHVIQH